jgi:cellulose synthase/poly-beta-1,6-N-acetylglucosamine synthase-like glycosyltransferase
LSGAEKPLVSVVLSVRNGAADLPRAVESILAQTFSDFELIAINNGSTDETAAVLDDLADPRVRVMHQDGVAFAAALNRGIALAHGRYIARQDHDDWAIPTRMEKQVAFLEANPDYAMVGTRAEIWAGNRKTNRTHDHPTTNQALQFELLFDNPFVHSSMMIRRSALEAVGLYTTDPTRQPPEDYELWSRIARCYKVANLPDRLTVYREVPNSMSRGRPTTFSERIALISAENLAKSVGEAAPGRLHWDISALFHRLPSRISANPDLEGMCDVIRNAGRRIEAQGPGSDVSVRVRERIKFLQFQLAEHRLLRRAGMLRHLVGLARRSRTLRMIARRLIG